MFLIVGPTTNFQLSDSSSGRYTHTDVWNQVWRYLSRNIFQLYDTLQIHFNLLLFITQQLSTSVSWFFSHYMCTTTIHTYCLFFAAKFVFCALSANKKHNKYNKQTNTQIKTQSEQKCHLCACSSPVSKYPLLKPCLQNENAQGWVSAHFWLGLGRRR